MWVNNNFPVHNEKEKNNSFESREDQKEGDSTVFKQLLSVSDNWGQEKCVC